MINCNSLVSENKRIEFKTLVDHHNPDIIFGCESKLDSSIATYSIFPENYAVYRKDRTLDGGGVFLCIKDSYVCQEQPNFDSDGELIWASLHFAGSRHFHFCSFYSPKTSIIHMTALKDSVDKVFQHKKSFPNIVICGDFNLPGVDWTNMSNTDGKHDNVKDLTFSLFDDYGLTQLVDTPT